VDLDFIGDIRRATDQPIRSRALVLDGQISAGDFRAARRGAALGLRDHEITGFYLVGERRREEISEHRGACDRACDGCGCQSFVLHVVILF
jgi:hypothetical protein